MMQTLKQLLCKFIYQFNVAETADEAVRVGDLAMELESRSNQIIENVDYVSNDLNENVLPKVRELQDLSDEGMTPIANIGTYCLSYV